jgi:hypothetical protein
MKGPAGFQVARIIQASLAAAIGLYGAIAILVMQADQGSKPENSLTYTLFGLAVITTAVARLFFQRAEAWQAPVRGLDDGSGEATGLPGGGASPFVLAIVAWAMFEAVGVFGLVLALLGGPGIYIVGGSFLLILLHPPRKDWFD